MVLQKQLVAAVRIAVRAVFAKTENQNCMKKAEKTFGSAVTEFRLKLNGKGVLYWSKSSKE